MLFHHREAESTEALCGKNKPNISSNSKIIRVICVICGFLINHREAENAEIRNGQKFIRVIRVICVCHLT